MSGQSTISQFLVSMGIAPPAFNPVPGAANLVSTVFTYMDVPVEIQIQSDELLIAQLLLGYVPKTNIPPLLRHLLGTNAVLPLGVYFCIFPQNEIVLRTGRHMQGMEFAEFKLQLDSLCVAYWQHGPSTVQTFQIAAQPA